MQPAANALYRKIWADRGTPLTAGELEWKGTKQEAMSRLDWKLGVDIIFEFENGASGTMQEKFLTTTFYSLTVEYMNDPKLGVKGDWFTGMFQYYFVGYYDTKKREDGFTRWVMVHWPMLQMSNVTWLGNVNKTDGAKANFKYIFFEDIPRDCIVASWEDYKVKQVALL